ncbi:MAG: hypothetical protein ACOVRN_14835 [Flavobacterium sp.]
MKHSTDIEEDIVVKDDTIFVKGVESWEPGCLVKTIQSIEYILHHDNTFDFVFRTNMSSVIDLFKLYEVITRVDNPLLYAGVITEYFGIHYASGAGILMSQLTCKQLIDNKSRLNYNTHDDVAIGALCQQLHIPLTPLTRYDTLELEDQLDAITADTIRNYYHFRCKSLKQYKLTLYNMKHIISLIYGDDIISHIVLD